MSEDEKPEVAQRSPYVQEMEPGRYFWCACGKSKKQPFCDGNHRGTSFQPVKLEITEKQKVAWCGCKATKKPPYCDGSHGKLE